MENFIRIYDEAIPSSLCDELIDIFESSDDKIVRDKKAKHHTEVSLAKISDTSIQKKLVKIVRTHFHQYIKENDFVSLLRYDTFDIEMFRIKKYEPGDFHKFHTDSTASDGSFKRFLAIQCYLNTVDEGGHTEFKLPEKLKIQPIKGRIVLFPTAWTHLHRGISPVNGPKYSMNSYLLFPITWLHEYYKLNNSKGEIHG